MEIHSEKILYDYLFKELYRNYDQALFLWGEELTDKRLYIYPGKIKDIPGYNTFSSRLINCGLITVNRKNDHPIACTSTRYDELTKTVYITENNFNGLWGLLKKSVALGIRLANQSETPCSIQSPKDILILDCLQRTGSTPALKNNRIIYLAKERSPEEIRLTASRQSAIDNQKNLYFYSKSSGYVHDRLCGHLKGISPEEFAASDTFPEGREYCPHCIRQIFIRIGCAPNAKEIPVCNRIFAQYNVGTSQIRRFVEKEGMRFHAKTLSEMTVTCGEDTWVISLEDGKAKLWHNNYVRVSPEERYITQGFHLQKTNGGSSLYQTLKYIANYSWQKHLAAENRIAETEIENANPNSMESDSTRAGGMKPDSTRPDGMKSDGALTSPQAPETDTPKASLPQRIFAYIKKLFC